MIVIQFAMANVAASTGGIRGIHSVSVASACSGATLGLPGTAVGDRVLRSSWKHLSLESYYLQLIRLKRNGLGRLDFSSPTPECSS